ncbi:transposase zinc-binding domain-containing protein, partial [Cupriavidus sp. TA19]|uniref:IS91 family transposase n=1 Tax=Cupriavidus sp. TA19 TaxID=701108 RepID=UPI00295F3479
MPAPLELADILRRHGPSHRQLHADLLGREPQRVMRAIEQCRTAALGGHVEQCDSCGHQRIAYNSCRNRHCPKCQSLARAQWLDDRQANLLPVPYFHVVFTVPEPIAARAPIPAIVSRAPATCLRRRKAAILLNASALGQAGLLPRPS